MKLVQLIKEIKINQPLPTLKADDFSAWLHKKFRINSDFLIKVRYELNGEDITKPLHDEFWQMISFYFKNNGVTHKDLNSLLYNRIRVMEKEIRDYEPFAEFYKDQLELLKYYRSEIKNIVIILPADDGEYRISVAGGRIKVVHQPI